MSPQVSIDWEAVSASCRRRHIARLALFGSVLRDDFKPDSDVDVLVEFLPGHVPGLRLVTIEREFSELLLVERDDLGCVGDGVFRQPRGACRQQGVPWRLGRFRIAGRRHTDHRHEATAVEVIALHHDARPAERGFGIRIRALPRFAVLCCWDTSSRNKHGVQRAAYRHGHGKRLSETDDKIGTTSRNACPLSEGGPHLRHLNRHVEMGMSDTENGRL